MLLDNWIANLTNQGRRMSVGPYRKGRNMDELVHVYWDGNTGRTGGWHACTEAEWFDLRVEPISGERVPAYRVALGRLFIDHHLGRDLPFGLVVSENKRTYTLLMTADDIREVYSDARHYGDGGMDEEYERENRDVVQAARRVMAGLEKQVPDQLQLACVCGHAADDHAIDDPSWVVPVCLTQYYRDASDCRCEYYQPAQ